MLFKNNTENTERVRIEEGTGVTKGYRWVTVKPSEEIEIPKEYGLNLGFTFIGESQEAEEPVADDETEEGIEEEDNLFSDELQAIDGIGKATVTDILEVYPNKASLLKAVQDNVELPFRNDVSLKLYAMFEAGNEEELAEESEEETQEE